MSAVRLTDRPHPGWDSLCERDSHATLFLHPRWMDAMTRAYPGFRPRFLERAAGDRLLGLLPFVAVEKLGLKQAISMPFGTHGGPVLDPDAPADAARDLVDAFAAEVRSPRLLRFEMTVFDPPAGKADPLEAVLGDHGAHFDTHTIDLTAGFDALWNREYDKETRTCVRRAEREGVTVEVERGADTLDELHRLHAEQARGWEGSRPHTREAMDAVAATLGDDVRLWVARREGRILGAVLTLYHRGREVYPWISGSAPDARPVRAMHLLYDRMLRHACEGGYALWNFGGSAGNPGIEAFKISLGARPRPVRRYFHEAGWSRRFRR